MRIIVNAWRDLAHPQAGGSERVVDVAASGLTERGHDVTVLAGGPVGDRPYSVLASGGKFDHYLRTPLIHRRLERADVVFDVASGMTYFSPLWCRRPVVLMTTHVHLDQWGVMFPPPVAAVGRLLEGRIAPFVYRDCLVLSISPSSTRDLIELGFSAANIRHLPIPVHQANATTTRSESPTFIALGRLVPYKRFDLLFEMWEEVRRHTGGTLIVIGDGPERERLEEIKPVGTTMLGFVPDEVKTAVLASSWLLIHTASHEGWGMVITEAGQHSVPSIGFDVAGVRDAIADGESGILAATRADFIDAWIALTADEDQRRRLGDRAAELAGRHDPSATVDAFEQAAAEAIEKASAT